MKVRQTLILFAVFVLGVLSAGAVLNRSSGAAPAAEAGVPGRYQATGLTGVDGGRANNKESYIVVTDTATGECWYKDLSLGDDSAWRRLQTPVTAK